MKQSLGEQVAAIEWYHTMELGPGIVTPGWLDHRSIVDRIPFPDSLQGMRCLDVGTFNGFWAFEMERRGAKEVLAIDVLDPRAWEWPVDSDAKTIDTIAQRMATGTGFEIAKVALSSSVQRLDMNVYDAGEHELGRFDLIYVGSLLLHLRDPVRALERLRSICDGMLIVVDGIDLFLSLRSPRLPVARLDGRGRPWWWYPNAAGLVRLVEVGGFDVVDRPERLLVPPGEGWRPPRWKARLLSSREGRYQLLAGWLGDPHVVVKARPRCVPGVSR